MGDGIGFGIHGKSPFSPENIGIWRHPEKERAIHAVILGLVPRIYCRPQISSH
jgi:hypothetical protein